MRNILEIKNLVVSYGGIEAVKGIDLKVEEGKIVTLIGSNGAGKSTTLKAVAGLVRPKSGEILLNDANLVGKSTDQIVSSLSLIHISEPSLGLAPIVVRGIFEIIREINRQGITVLLIEQNANMALKIADWAYVMQTGSILMQGPGEELAANEEVKAAYLGTAK